MLATIPLDAEMGYKINHSIIRKQVYEYIDLSSYWYIYRILDS